MLNVFLGGCLVILSALMIGIWSGVIADRRRSR